jgi:hypothetical protein
MSYSNSFNSHCPAHSPSLHWLSYSSKFNSSCPAHSPSLHWLRYSTSFYSRCPTHSPSLLWMSSSSSFNSRCPTHSPSQKLFAQVQCTNLSTLFKWKEYVIKQMWSSSIVYRWCVNISEVNSGTTIPLCLLVDICLYYQNEHNTLHNTHPSIFYNTFGHLCQSLLHS